MPILNNKGFTIIELLIVIAILGILAMIGFSTFSGIQQSARDAKRKADVDAISKALEAKYNFASGKYLLQSGLADSDFTSGTVPKDNGQPYHFERSEDEKAFIVCATTLEKENQSYCKYSANGSAASIATLTVPTMDEEQPPAEEPPPPPAPPAKKVFVTSSTYNSNLGGLDGADAKCQQAADAEAGLNGGTYKAWLSDDTGGPSTRFTFSESGYQKVDGVKIANSWTDLLDGSLLSGIDKTESNGNGSGILVFSNTGPSGAVQNTDVKGHCNRWTYFGWQFNDPNGSNLGLSGQTDSTWTYSVSGDCNWPRALYCFEQ